MESKEYEFKLCTSAADLRASYDLRLEVFHREQKFSKELEVDNYDPISAHFIVVSKNDGIVVASVRITPYPLTTEENFDLNEPQEYDQEFPLGAVRSEKEIKNDFIGSIARQECPCVKLSRMVVKGSLRRKGIGSMAIDETEKWLTRVSGGQELIVTISSQMQAKYFYEKLGYAAQGEPYDEEGMQHIMCRKRLREL